MTRTGHCLCSAVTFALEGPHNWAGHCYCDSCRRNSGAPVITFVGHPDGKWRWTGQVPTCFESSPGTRRHFCPRCGSSVAYASDRYPNETHFHATLLDDPSVIEPTGRFHADEKLPWPDL